LRNKKFWFRILTCTSSLACSAMRSAAAPVTSPH
jgi:hypothetical protein